MARRAGFAVLVLGAALSAWVGVTVVWGDPITSLYTRHEQHTMSRQLDASGKQWATPPLARSIEPV